MNNIRHLLEPQDFSVKELGSLLELADSIVNAPEKYAEKCKGKILASLFYEPSTRTKFSFDAAMLRLGGQVIGFSDPNTSSTAKGETVADSAKTVSQYADIIVVRHPKEGTARLMSKHADCPVINAGDGGHQHPTQTLTDLLTIMHYKKRLTDLTIGVCGDLMFGRTIHSLVSCLSRFSNVKFVFISPDELKMFINEEEYMRLKDFFILTRDKLDTAKKDMIVMHPLPRVNEIATDVDDDPRAVYFNQVKFGMYVRMALILSLLRLDERSVLS